VTGASWLLLAYQLPSRPSNARVATWRRLQRVGAVQLHGSAYVLPATAEAREDLEWIAEDVIGHGGEATLFAAETTEPRSRDSIVEAFRRTRAEEYAAIRVEAESPGRDSGRRAAARIGANERRQLAARLRERLAATVAIDFFAAAGREEAEAAIAALERKQEDVMSTETGVANETRLSARDFRDRVWVTRPRPGVDRMSTAWLVRRFIDPGATFRFSDPERRSELGADAVPFDMVGVDLGHQRGGCTFETVARRFAIGDPSVVWLARIVHQLDLKTGEPTPPDAAVIGQMVEGLRRMYADDADLLEHGIVMFESLYQSDGERRRAGAPAGKTKAGSKRAPSRRSS
jgi:hypothetical protein